MFWNVYKKYITGALRTKEIVVWTLIFPVFLSALFYFAFSSLEESDALCSIPVGIVKDAAYDEEPYFDGMLTDFAEGENPLLLVTEVKEEKEADILLKNGEIDGYIMISAGKPVLYVKESGMNQTVLKKLLDGYLQTKTGITKAAGKNAAALFSIGKMNPETFAEDRYSIEEIAFSENKPSSTVNYFYTLLAMTCLFGAFHGIEIITSMQANLSPLGARKTVSPGSRGEIFGAAFLAAVTVQFFCTAVGLCFIRFVLKISFGGQFFYALLTCFMGCLVGISFGCLVSVPSKWKSGMKSSVTIAVSLVCCFLAGMMVGGINYVVAEKAPFLAVVNPAARIADSFYCLYYYDNHVRFFRNIGALAVMAAVMLLVSLISARRKVYESI